MKRTLGTAYGFNITPHMEEAVYSRLRVHFDLSEVKNVVRTRYGDDIEAMCALPAYKKYRPAAVVDRIADALIRRWRAAEYVAPTPLRGRWERIRPQLKVPA